MTETNHDEVGRSMGKGSTTQKMKRRVAFKKKKARQKAKTEAAGTSTRRGRRS